MIIPALTNDTTQDAYFPPAIWRDIQTNALLESGKHTTMTIEMTDIVVAIRGGAIIPTQDPKTTTYESRQQPFRIMASLDDKGRARGSLFWDDGVTDNTYNLGLYNLIQFDIEQVRRIISHTIRIETILISRISLRRRSSTLATIPRCLVRR